MRRFVLLMAAVLALVAALSGAGCSLVIAGMGEDPSAVLEQEHPTRADVEVSLGAPVRSTRYPDGGALSDYEYRFVLPDHKTDWLLTGGAGGGDQALVATALRVAIEPVVLGAVIADKEARRQPGRVTVSYAPDGTVEFWYGTRSTFDVRRKERPKDQDATGR